MSHRSFYNEAYIQFGYEQDEDLRDALAEPFVDAVVYYTFYLPFTREVIGYVEFTPDNKKLGFSITGGYGFNEFECAA